jgi:hypothetical protein
MDALLVRKFFRGEVRTTPRYPLVSQAFKTVVAVLPVVVVALLTRSWIGAAQGFTGVALRLVLVCGVAAVCYMACSVALHIDGWRMLLGRIRHRLPAASPFGSAGR